MLNESQFAKEYERMFRTRGVHGFRLYPDRAYLEELEEKL